MKRRNSKRLLIRIFFLVLISAFIQTIPASAVSVKKKAMRAYRNMLDKGVVTYKGTRYSVKGDTFFSPVYVDNDDIPELVVFLWGETELTVLYNYRKGKISRVSAETGGMGTPAFVYYEKTGIFRYAHPADGALGFKFYRLSSGKKRLVMKQNTKLSSTRFMFDTVTPLDECYINGKRVSLDTYNTYLGKITHNKNAIRKSGVKNTKKNREKYLK